MEMTYTGHALDASGMTCASGVPRAFGAYRIEGMPLSGGASARRRVRGSTIQAPSLPAFQGTRVPAAGSVVATSDPTAVQLRGTTPLSSEATLTDGAVFGVDVKGGTIPGPHTWSPPV
jgi:hypothetical protein